MSRIGKQHIILSDQIDVHIKDQVITIKGPKGSLSQNLSELVIVTLSNVESNKTLSVSIKEKSKKAQQIHGLSRTLINNMVIGVSNGFRKDLEIRGVGYRSQLDGNNLILNVGYSHPVVISPPKNISIQIENNTNIIVQGINKETVGLIAAKIRDVRPPEPYKGKGIRYKNETVKKKIGKAGK
uniref:Large ribosomal subunit protein uL6c n=1 Tax=Dichotomaria marginata TaxID=268567 RepID=A0A1G4NSR5_9FLOR|nr:Ribosomal protein L6 [Dichotomaria marginata]SCW21606.1 Ribosomal protein L6 [Dichotomaria marginata]